MTGGLIIRPAPHLPPVREWVRPGRVPSKAAGRKGTRRAWKRKHPPRWVVDPTRTHSFVHDGVLYVDPASFDRMRKASAELGIRMTARRAGKTAAAFRDLGLSAEQLGGALRGLSASFVVTDGLE